MVDNRSIRKIELPPSDNIRKRSDTSGRATAELASELQKRSITSGNSSAESNE